MASNEHLVVKPEKLVAVAAGALEQSLVLPNLFHKEGIDQYKGAKDDAVNVVVEGLLPFHDYEWRSGSATSSTPGTRQKIVFDEYAERKIQVKFGGNVYSGVKMTDEQYVMDLNGWGKLLGKQTRAVGRGLQRRAGDTLMNAGYNVVIGNALQNLRGAIIEARRILNAFNVPEEQRYFVVGTGFEAALLNDKDLNLAQNVGDAEAVSALKTATLSQKYGFTFIVDQTIGADDAYAILPSGYVFASAAPPVPNGAPYGATTSYEGIALRWICDYDTEYQEDRSVVNTWPGFRTVEDVLVGYDTTTKQEFVSTDEYFVRGVKLTLDGSSNYPAASSELAKITGISDAKVWTPTGAKAETDPANA